MPHIGTERRHLLLVNPSAGLGRAGGSLPQVEDEFRRRGLEYRLVETESLEHAREQAVAAAGDGEIPVVMGGDGMLGQIGGALVGAEAPMGILPGGRGNDLARVLGIGTEVPEAMDVIEAGHTRAIDVGEANGRRFLGIASCGFDSDANRIANEAKLVRGHLVYLYAALRALAAWKPARFGVSVDGERTEFSGYSVAAANSKAFGGGMYMAPNAELDDGELDVVMCGDASKLHFLANLPKVFKGTHVDDDEITVLRGAVVEITADRPFAVYADGDHITDLPVTVRLLSRALRVIAPEAD